MNEIIALCLNKNSWICTYYMNIKRRSWHFVLNKIVGRASIICKPTVATEEQQLVK